MYKISLSWTKVNEGRLVKESRVTRKGSCPFTRRGSLRGRRGSKRQEGSRVYQKSREQEERATSQKAWVEIMWPILFPTPIKKGSAGWHMSGLAALDRWPKGECTWQGRIKGRWQTKERLRTRQGKHWRDLDASHLRKYWGLVPYDLVGGRGRSRSRLW